MNPSSSISDLTLEQAAGLVATRAQLLGRNKIAVDGLPNLPATPSVAPAAPTAPAPAAPAPAAAPSAAAGMPQWMQNFSNMSPGMQGALVGGGVGLGTGLLSSLFRREPKKHYLRNSLLGAALGGGIGGATGYGLSQLPTASGKHTTLEELIEARKKLKGTNGPSSETPEIQYGPAAKGLWWLGNKLRGQSSGEGTAAPEDPALAANTKAIEEAGGNLQEIDGTEGMPAASYAASYAANLPLATEAGVGGYLGGQALQRGGNALLNNRAVTNAEIINSARNNPAAFDNAVGSSLADLVRQSKPFREHTGQTTWKGLPVPFTGTTREGFRYEPVHNAMSAGPPPTPHDLNVSPHQMERMRDIARSQRKPHEGGTLGGRVGGALGFLAALLAGKGAHPEVSP